MTSHPTDRVVKRGWFLYDGSTRCNVEIVQTNFRPGCDDDEAPVEDAHGEFYEIRYFWPGKPSCTGGGYCNNIAEAMATAEMIVKKITWE